MDFSWELSKRSPSFFNQHLNNQLNLAPMDIEYRHLIHHQTLFVGSIWMGNTVEEGHWMGHAEGLSHRFWLGFAKILMFFPSS
jgi:hypothetical protein